MKVILAFRDPDARMIAYYLRRRYKSKAGLVNLESGLANLIKVAISREVADEAAKELKEIEEAQNG